MTGAAGLTKLNVLVIHVANLANGGLGVHGDQANFAAGQTDLSVSTFLSHQLGRVAGAAGDLRALAGLDLDAVYHGADGYLTDLHRVADLDVRAFAGKQRVADLQAKGSDDVALFAVCIVQQGNVRAAVRIVFDGGNLGGHAVLVALEVDDPVLAPRAAAAMANGDAAMVIAAAGGAKVFQKGFFRRGAGDLLESGDGHEALAGSGGFDLPYSHCVPPYWAMLSKNSIPLESFFSFT